MTEKTQIWLIVIAGVWSLPLVAYFVVWFATCAYFRAKHLTERHNKECA